MQIIKKPYFWILIATLIFSAWLFYFLKTPTGVVAKAAVGISFKSRKIFDSAVDIAAVAEHLADDSVALVLKKSGADPLEKKSGLEQVLSQAMVAGLKPQIQALITKTVDTYFLGDPIVNSSGESMNSLVLMLLASKSSLKYSWGMSLEKGDGFALATIPFKEEKTGQEVKIRLRLEPSGDSYRIVRVINLAESLAK